MGHIIWAIIWLTLQVLRQSLFGFPPLIFQKKLILEQKLKRLKLRKVSFLIFVNYKSKKDIFNYCLKMFFNLV